MSERKMDDSSISSAGQESSAADLSAIFNYPHLGRLFEGDAAQPLTEMRARLTHTTQELERVVRRGGQKEAASAMLALRAYEVAVDLLGELERLRGKTG